MKALRKLERELKEKGKFKGYRQRNMLIGLYDLESEIDLTTKNCELKLFRCNEKTEDEISKFIEDNNISKFELACDMKWKIILMYYIKEI